MTDTYLVENRHDAADCDAAFASLEEAVAASGASVRDNTLLCTCPHGTHGGSLVVEAETAGEAEVFTDEWDVGETTVSQIREMLVGGE